MINGACLLLLHDCNFAQCFSPNQGRISVLAVPKYAYRDLSDLSPRFNGIFVVLSLARGTGFLL